MDRCDVLVAGAGLAGLACARDLAAAGLDTILIDQKRALGERVHTTGIFVRRTLEDFALPDACLGPVVRDVALYSPRRRRLDLSSPHDEFRVGRMPLLYQRMREEAEERGARVWLAHRLVGAGRVAGGVEVQLERAGAPAGAARRRVVHARYVVGADGARSPVAAALGLDRNRDFLIGAEDVLHSSAPGRPVMHCFVDPVLAPGYLAWVVDDGEEAHVGVAGDPGRFRPLEALAAFRRSLDGVVPLSRERLERRGGRIPVGGLLARIADDRALLVGDAAGAVSPLTAGGLDPCLRQSRLAVQVIGAWLGGGQRAALDAYASPALRRRFRGRMWMRRGMNQLRDPRAAELALAVLRTGPLSALASRVFFGRGSFPDLDLATLLADQETGVSGPRRRSSTPKKVATKPATQNAMKAHPG